MMTGPGEMKIPRTSVEILSSKISPIDRRFRVTDENCLEVITLNRQLETFRMCKLYVVEKREKKNRAPTEIRPWRPLIWHAHDSISIANWLKWVQHRAPHHYRDVIFFKEWRSQTMKMMKKKKTPTGWLVFDGHYNGFTRLERNENNQNSLKKYTIVPMSRHVKDIDSSRRPDNLFVKCPRRVRTFENPRKRYVYDHRYFFYRSTSFQFFLFQIVWKTHRYWFRLS